MKVVLWFIAWGSVLKGWSIRKVENHCSRHNERPCLKKKMIKEDTDVTLWPQVHIHMCTYSDMYKHGNTDIHRHKSDSFPPLACPLSAVHTWAHLILTLALHPCFLGRWRVCLSHTVRTGRPCTLSLRAIRPTAGLWQQYLCWLASSCRSWGPIGWKIRCSPSRPCSLVLSLSCSSSRAYTTTLHLVFSLSHRPPVCFLSLFCGQSALSRCRRTRLDTSLGAPRCWELQCVLPQCLTPQHWRWQELLTSCFRRHLVFKLWF